MRLGFAEVDLSFHDASSSAIVYPDTQFFQLNARPFGTLLLTPDTGFVTVLTDLLTASA